MIAVQKSSMFSKKMKQFEVNTHAFDIKKAFDVQISSNLKIFLILSNRSPLDKFPFYMLIETSGSNQEHDEEKLSKFLSKAMETSLVVDGVSTNEPGKMRNIWLLRERIADSLINIDGYCFKYDISLPLSHFYEIVPATQKKVGDLASFVCGYGHVGKENRLILIQKLKLSTQVTQIFISTLLARSSLKKFTKLCILLCMNTRANFTAASRLNMELAFTRQNT